MNRNTRVDRPVRRVLVTGGAGYVGAVLVPKLLAAGYDVRVVDWYLFDPNALAAVRKHPGLEEIEGDIRDESLLRRAMVDCDAVIHLACVANDPSFELDPTLSKSINFDAFEPLVRRAKEAGVARFIYASTSSVYGVSNAPQVTEDHPLVPITDYNRYKGLCEPVLWQHCDDTFVGTVIRPATVCGVSPRQRLDLTVNILTTHAVERGRITVFGGKQKRPNIHIDDITDLYRQLLREPIERVAGKTWNAGWQNQTVADIAQAVRRVVMREAPHLGEIDIVTEPSDDIRSYHIASKRIADELGFVPRRTIEDAIHDVTHALLAGQLPGALDDPHYYNVRLMKQRMSQLSAA